MKTLLQLQEASQLWVLQVAWPITPCSIAGCYTVNDWLAV